MMSIALVKLWATTNNYNYLIRAKKIVDILMRDFSKKNSLFSRSIDDNEIYSLDDNVAILEALTMAYQISGQIDYLEKSKNLSDAILSNFLNENGSLYSSCGDVIVEPNVVPSSNYSAAFSIHQLGNILESDNLKSSAKSIVYSVYTTSFDSSEYLMPYILLSKKYFDEEPFHAVWIAEKFGSELELKLIQEIILQLGSNFVFDKINMKQMTEEQSLLYKSSESNTLFMCTSEFCSSPIKSVEELRRFFSNQ